MDGQQSITVIGRKAPPTLDDNADRSVGLMARRLPPALRKFGMPALSLFIVVAVWQLLSSTVFNRHLVPPPLTVVETAIPMLMSGEILRHIGISLVRILIGF